MQLVFTKSNYTNIEEYYLSFKIHTGTHKTHTHIYHIYIKGSLYLEVLEATN